MADVELLPCPWCGEKLASVSVSEGSTFRWRKVDGCCADGPEIRHDTMADDQQAAEADSRARAIAAWNTRANVAHATAAKDAEIEALRAEVGELHMHAKRRDQYAVEKAAQALYWKNRAERLAEALRSYGVHDQACVEANIPICTCGLDAALDQENDDA